MSLRRIGEMRAEVGRLGAAKAARGAEIAGLCAAIQELWTEMCFEPADDVEAAVPRGGEVRPSPRPRLPTGCGCGVASRSRVF